MPTDPGFTPPPTPPLPSTPERRAPEGAADCHFHIFGPFDRFPPSPRRPYDPPLARLEDYRPVAATLGLSRFVIVQASVYGSDNRVTEAAIAGLGRDVARGVTVLDPGAAEAEIARLDGAGFVGARFNAVSGGGTPLAALEDLAARIKPFGWHIQLYVEGDLLPELAPRLAELPVPVVFDHMAGIPAEAGLRHPGFAALRALLERGRAWVKLCGYRVSAGPSYHDLAPLARALIEAAPERMLWGTDWPHTQIIPPPDAGKLLDLLGAWVRDETDWRRILVENPETLYGFGR